MKLIEKQIRIPEELVKKVTTIAELAGLATDQMIQAIITLQFHGTGWFREELRPQEEPKAKKGTTTRRAR